jgi:two-component system response regulator AtoC
MDSPKGSLLIVDDEAGIRKVLSSILQKYTSSVQTAAHGKEALDIIRKGSIDAVLSDITMPTMGGLELLANIRSMGMETPFVFLTGHGDKEKCIEALRLGATDFLEKPFDPPTVIEVIRRALELSHAMQEVEKETEKLYTSAKIPADEVIRLRKVRKAIAMMRLAMKIYTKK